MSNKNEVQQIQEQLGMTNQVKLIEPIETVNGVVDTLTLRRVKVKDYKFAAQQYPENAALQQLAALAVASGLQQEDFENLCWEDYQQISKFCLGI